MRPKEIATFCLQSLKKMGADAAECTLLYSTDHELCLERDSISLLRTLEDQKITITAIKEKRKGSISINHLDKKSLQEAFHKLMEIVDATEPDEANKMASFQKAESFQKGVFEPDLPLMYDRMREFKDSVSKLNPYLVLDEFNLNFLKYNKFYMNSNQVDFEVIKGYYQFVAVFTSKKGEKSSSLNYTYCTNDNLNKPLLDFCNLKSLVQSSGEQIETSSVIGKWQGDVIITPDCMQSFVSYFINFISDYALISGNSIYKGKLEEKIASELLTIHSKPTDSMFFPGYFITSDGFKAKDSTIIDKGVLKTFLLSLYGSEKTGLERAKNNGSYFKIDSGDTSLKDMIKNVKKGIILCRFSGGNPSDNGEFSGIAKNSYYVENGEIKFPISETMISGNIAKMLLTIKSVSKESIHFGYSQFPWVTVGDLTISGNK